MTEKYKNFENIVKEGARYFKKISDKSTPVKVVSHLDSDGICAASIIIKMLIRENMRYSLSIVPQLKEETISEFSDEEYRTFIFTDLGAGNLDAINKAFHKRNVIILDHHKPNGRLNVENGIHINPHLFGISGDSEISGSGVVFYFAREVNEKNSDMAHVALIGAIGDVQEKNGFSHLNNLIMESSINAGKIERKKTIRFFGSETKPLYKLLAYSTEVFVPGVTGSESKSIQFLNDLGIPPSINGRWRMLSHLTQKELESLITGMIIKRKSEEDPHDILGYVYKIKDEKEGQVTRDLKEFSTMLNACGRLNRASIGIGVCLGDEKSKKEASKVLSEYKKELLSAIKWFEKNSSSEKIIRKDGYIIVNAGENIPSTMIGTLGSMISHSDDIPEGTYILTLAKNYTGEIKASLRISGKRKKGTDLKKIIDEIVISSGGEAGGHSYAAGAIIPLELESLFIASARSVLERMKFSVVTNTVN